VYVCVRKRLLIICCVPGEEEKTAMIQQQDMISIYKFLSFCKRDLAGKKI
jgi:hypothetical protein